MGCHCSSKLHRGKSSKPIQAITMNKFVAYSCLAAVACAAPSPDADAWGIGYGAPLAAAHVAVAPAPAAVTITTPKCTLTYEEIETQNCVPKVENVCDTVDVEQESITFEKECKDVTSKVCGPAAGAIPIIKREAETGARPGTLPNSCTQRADPGLCLADFPMYYFDAGSKTCQKFSYGGCGGNGNRFPTEAACLTTCMGSSLGKKCCEGYICQTYPTNQCIKIVKQICIMTGGACIPGHPIEKCCPNNVCTIKKGEIGESFLAKCVEEIEKPKQHCLATGDPCTPGDPINKCCPNNLCDLDNKVCVQVAWKNKNV